MLLSILSRNSLFWLLYASPRGNNFIKKSDSSRAQRKEHRAAMFVLAYGSGTERSWAGESLAGVIVTRNCCPLCFINYASRRQKWTRKRERERLVGGAREKKRKRETRHERNAKRQKRCWLRICMKWSQSLPPTPHCLLPSVVHFYCCVFVLLLLFQYKLKISNRNILTSVIINLYISQRR